MRYLSLLYIFFIPCCLKAQTSGTNKNIFLVKPYLQVGNPAAAETLQLLWHTNDANAEWTTEYQPGGGGSQWINAGKPGLTPITAAGTDNFVVCRTLLTNLVPGSKFMYRVLKNKELVFSAMAAAPKRADQPSRFIVSGDMGAGTEEAKQIARGMLKVSPDLIAVAGDIVYDYGLISDYKTKFWPIYNADKMDTAGVPLMRSIPFVAAMGNHDADTRDLDKHPDALAYYLFWDQPLNGPVGKEGGPIVPVLRGASDNLKAFYNGAGNRYPAMANFSFNYGNAHWTVLDADTYVDWTDTTLTNWVAKDLADSKDMTWHFVLYHHPGFNSSREHYEQQHMRLLSPVFEKGNVDMVFCGHVHNYQRSFPMHFTPDNKGTLLVGGKDAKTIRGRVVTGIWKLDKMFDGKKNTKPNGVIYIITGAGGQELYNPEQTNDPDSWQKFTDKFISTIHSFTQVDINGKTLLLQQVTASGRVIDSIRISK